MKNVKKTKNKHDQIYHQLGGSGEGWLSQDYLVKTTARKQSSSVDNKVKAQ